MTPAARSGDAEAPALGGRPAALPSWLPWVIGGLLLVLYWPALNGTRLWDDQAHITKPALQSLGGLWRIWFELGATQQYYPVLHSVFWMEHHLWGEATIGYHLANLMWHGLSAWLFGRLLIRWDFARAGAVIAALLFVVHPVCVESVAWISEQKNTLSLVFALLAALAYQRFQGTGNWRDYARGSVWFLLALGTKSVTATLPGVLLVAAWWRSGVPALRRAAPTLLAWLAAGIAAGLFTAHVEKTMIGAEGAEFTLSAATRCLLAGKVVWFYLTKLAWPAPLMFVYPHWDMASSSATTTGILTLVALLLATVGLAWFALRAVAGRSTHECSSRAPLAAWLCFVGTLLPVLGFVNVYPFRFSYVADHFQYQAALSVFAVVGAGVGALIKRHRAPAVAGAVVVGVALAVTTRTYSAAFRDDFALYAWTLRRNPSAWMAEHNLGTALTEQGRNEEAIPHFERAVAIRPDYAEALVNWGSALYATGHPDEAADKYARALKIQPVYAEARNDLGFALAHLGRPQEAAAQFGEAIREDGGFAPAHFNLANLLRQAGQTDAAIGEYEAAVLANPAYADALMNLGNLRLQRGEIDAAIARLRAAAAAKPDSAPAHNSLGYAYFKQGNLDAAATEYRESIRLQPAYRPAHLNLAYALHQAGREEEARAELAAAQGAPSADAPAAAPSR